MAIHPHSVCYVAHSAIRFPLGQTVVRKDRTWLCVSSHSSHSVMVECLCVCACELVCENLAAMLPYGQGQTIVRDQNVSHCCECVSFLFLTERQTPTYVSINTRCMQFMQDEVCVNAPGECNRKWHPCFHIKGNEHVICWKVNPPSPGTGLYNCSNYYVVAQELERTSCQMSAARTQPVSIHIYCFANVSGEEVTWEQ